MRLRRPRVVELTVRSDGEAEPVVTDQYGRIVQNVSAVRWRQEPGGPGEAVIEVCPIAADLRSVSGRVIERDEPPAPRLDPDRVAEATGPLPGEPEGDDPGVDERQ